MLSFMALALAMPVLGAAFIAGFVLTIVAVRRDRRDNPVGSAPTRMTEAVRAAQARGEAFVFRVPRPWQVSAAVTGGLVLVSLLFVAAAVVGLTTGLGGVRDLNFAGFFFAACALGVAAIVTLVMPPWPGHQLLIDGRTVRIGRTREFPFREVTGIEQRVVRVPNLESRTSDTRVVLVFHGATGALDRLASRGFSWPAEYVAACVQVLLDLRDGRDPRVRRADESTVTR